MKFWLLLWLLSVLALSASFAQETALEELQARGAKTYYERDADGKPTSKLLGIGIPYDWMGNEYSLDLVAKILARKGLN